MAKERGIKKFLNYAPMWVQVPPSPMELKEKIQKFKKYFKKIKPYKEKPRNGSDRVWRKVKNKIINQK